MRITLLAVAMALVGSVLPVFAQAAIQHYQLNIPRQPLDTALKDFAHQTGLQVARMSDAVDGSAIVGPVRGELSAQDALKSLLGPRGLSYKMVNERTIAIVKSGDESTSSSALSTSPEKEGARAKGNGEDSSGDRLHLGQTPQGSSSSAPPVDSSSPSPREKRGGQGSEDFSSNKIALEEIVVTAEKRSEKLMDVPSSIGVISGEHLELLQSYSLSDFAGYVPGLTVAAGGSPGQNMLVIRGLATGYRSDTNGPLVATYIDDVPVSSSNAAARGALFGFDVMPYDIERIEVLRGPQGTLYGASAMGGLVKYSLRKPDLTAFDAQVGTDIEDINGSSRPGAGGRTSINLPVIAETLGIRASGFYQNNAGYIDDIGTGTRDANHSTESGGRATVLWKVADSLSVQATVLAQDIHSADQAAVTLDGTSLQPVFGRQVYSRLFPGTFAQRARNYSLTVDWDLQFATLTNSSSWSRMNSKANFDTTKTFTSFIPYPGAINLYILGDKISKFTEEMRLTSPQNQRIQWMLGGFYTKEDGEENGDQPSFTSTYVPLPADNIEIYTTTHAYKERAVFGNATFLISDSFDIGGGARYAQNTETDCIPMDSGLFGAGPVPCSSRPYVGVSTWMADARFHLDRNSMFYLRWATGYRAGGCNSPCTGSVAFQIPGTFNPDKVTNYEGGFKGEFFDHRLQLDLSVFHIDWRNIQAQVINSLGIAYAGNGGTAISNGVEITTSYRITERLSLKATLDHTDAHLTQDAPGISGKNGDQLPESPRWSGSLMAEYHQPLAEGRQFVLGGGYRYRDKVDNQFAGSGKPLPIGPQNIVDLYTQLVMNHVSARIYTKNIFNNRAYMGLLALDDPKMPMFVPVQPRTIGLSLDYQFK